MISSSMRKIAQIIYTLFAIVLPLVALCFFSEQYIHGMERMWGYYYLGLIVFFIPIFAVYASILVREYFPKTVRTIGTLFIPVIISIAGLWPHIFGSSEVSIQTVLFATTAPYIVGLAAIMGGGVTYLAFKMINTLGGVGAKEFLLRMFVLTLIVGPWGYYIYVISVGGYSAWQDMDIPQWTTPLFWYFMQIGIIIASVYPKLIEQYHKGNL